jgi:ABC-type lipoprotein release transport system permease subunit
VGVVGFAVAFGFEEVTTEAPGVLLVVPALMMAAGILACVVPARRGLRIQPTEALREGG